jgi:hypothetical protein
MTESGQYILGKGPIHTQILITPVGGGAKVYIPVKNFSWKKATEMEANKHSGSALSSSLVDGHHDYTVSFETGTWVTASPTNVNLWEWLAYTHLVRPEMEGRPKTFEIEHVTVGHYDYDVVDGAETAIAPGTVIKFTGCKITDMGENMGESGVITRSYEATARRLTYGLGDTEMTGPGLG